MACEYCQGTHGVLDCEAARRDGVARWPTRTPEEIRADLETVCNLLCNQNPQPEIALLPERLFHRLRWRGREGTREHLRARVTDICHSGVELYDQLLLVPEPGVVVILLRDFKEGADGNWLRTSVMAMCAGEMPLGTRYIVETGPTWQHSGSARRRTPVRMMHLNHLHDAFIECERRLVAAKTPGQEAEWGRRVAQINDELARRAAGGEVQYYGPVEGFPEE